MDFALKKNKLLKVTDNNNKKKIIQRKWIFKKRQSTYKTQKYLFDKIITIR